MSDRKGSPALFFQITLWRGGGRQDGKDLGLFWGGFSVGGVGGRDKSRKGGQVAHEDQRRFIVLGLIFCLEKKHKAVPFQTNHPWS